MSENYDYFMRLDVTPYVGQWIGICDSKVVSHSGSIKEAYSEVKKVCGYKKPFVALVPSDKVTLL
jgi:hypothetical protein